jgi:hypothetical protein
MEDTQKEPLGLPRLRIAGTLDTTHLPLPLNGEERQMAGV